MSGDSKCEDQEGGVTQGAVPGEPCQAAARTSTWTTSQEGHGVFGG